MKQNGLGDILADFGIRIVPTRQRRQPGDTHALGVLRRIVAAYGEVHLAASLRLIRASPRNAESLHSETIAAVSDVLAVIPPSTDDRSLAAAFDAVDLDHLRARAVALRPWPVRSTLRVFLLTAIERRLPAVSIE